MELNEALNNMELAKKIEEAENMNEVISILKNAGVETTEEELLKLLPSQDDELPDESLEDVSGGLYIGKLPLISWVLLKLIKKGKIKPSDLLKIPGGGGFLGGGSR